MCFTGTQIYEFKYPPQPTTVMRFMLSIRKRLYNRTRRAREREMHQHIMEKVVIRAADNELKSTYQENDHGYDPNFAEAVEICLRLQESYSQNRRR